MNHFTDEYRKELNKLDLATKNLHKTITIVQGISVQSIIDEV
jgi:hypothetical protein